MATVSLDSQLISDWTSFHEVCKKTFGFPDFYGASMNAWIDCLSYLRDDDSMTRFHLAESETLSIEIISAATFKNKLPEIYDALVECTAFVNIRYAEAGEPLALNLIFL